MGELLELVVDEEAAAPIPAKKVRVKAEVPDVTDHVAEVYRTLSLDKLLMRVTKYVTSKLVVRITRRKFKHGGGVDQTALLTVGKPNFAEKKFIRDCVRSSEPFPVAKVQLKFFPTKKKAKKASAPKVRAPKARAKKTKKKAA